MTATYSELQDKVVLVTGGGSGIGESIVRGFARQKACVAFMDNAIEPSRALADELAADGISVHFEPCDLRCIDSLQSAIATIRQRLGSIQVLVNNAASDERHATDAVSEPIWDNCIAINLKQQFFCAQAVLPDMKAARAGAIVNLGSISWIVGHGGMAGYTASKSAILGLTRSLARDYGPYGVRVNAVAPGWIMTRRQLEKWVTPETEAEIMARQCLKRKLQPAEIANVVVFLASDEASACTSQHYIVDGGWV
ncbi:MAG TPA: SDR family NAD(P)-dependent oxidoreductase [Steroidobacteraceae bacterium]|nr:SDR family NAD(P)-dependent oxidoreductase [Steroidobacteraceae bacterium]